MLAVSVAPLLRRELAHVFTLRTECHPENKCALTLVVRSSGLILAFLNPAGDKHRSPPTRRAIANTARQHGAAVRSTGCTPYHILYTLRSHTCCTQVRGGTLGWWWAQRKRPAERSGAMPAVRTLSLASRCGSIDMFTRYPPWGIA